MGSLGGGASSGLGGGLIGALEMGSLGGGALSGLGGDGLVGGLGLVIDFGLLGTYIGSFGDIDPLVSVSVSVSITKSQVGQHM